MAVTSMHVLVLLFLSVQPGACREGPDVPAMSSSVGKPVFLSDSLLAVNLQPVTETITIEFAIDESDRVYRVGLEFGHPGESAENSFYCQAVRPSRAVFLPASAAFSAFQNVKYRPAPLGCTGALMSPSIPSGKSPLFGTCNITVVVAVTFDQVTASEWHGSIENADGTIIQGPAGRTTVGVLPLSMHTRVELNDLGEEIFIFGCKTAPSSPAVNVTIIVPNPHLEERGHNLTGQGQIELPVQFLEAYNGTEWMCQADVEYPRTQAFVETATVRAEYAPLMVSSHEEMVCISPPCSFNLSCAASALPPASYYWSHLSPVAEYEDWESGNTLFVVVPDLEPPQDLLYSCEARNEFGTARKTFAVWLRKQEDDDMVSDGTTRPSLIVLRSQTDGLSTNGGVVKFGRVTEIVVTSIASCLLLIVFSCAVVTYFVSSRVVKRWFDSLSWGQRFVAVVSGFTAYACMKGRTGVVDITGTPSSSSSANQVSPAELAGYSNENGTIKSVSSARMSQTSSRSQKSEQFHSESIRLDSRVYGGSIQLPIPRKQLAPKRCFSVQLGDRLV